ncbi:hypothetical protein Vadar_026405 [Vaccinium darrowii]|uniref:Uncharacterized protein n=1 Tax=Vaccinium darrowii TaxID=229202 RepID=A0ACB7X3Y5_9ERIC|nr:hypothetical protein Vadar_026405 [Vaccinium darrowii]
MKGRKTRPQKRVIDLESEEGLHPVANNNHGLGIVRSFRDVPPAHYYLKINSFSFLVNNEVENYESGVFEVGGYKWKLSLHPTGNKKRNVTDHISLYLGLEDTKTLPPGWEVNVSFKLFAFDHIRDRYLTIQEGEIQRFHLMKTQRGHKWNLLFYTNGCSTTRGKSVSLYLNLADCGSLPDGRKMYVEFKLRMKNQANGDWHEFAGKRWYCASSLGWGFSKFMALSDFSNSSKGFLMNDAVVIEAQITQIFAPQDI